jgi:hypothetical protein
MALELLSSSVTQPTSDQRSNLQPAVPKKRRTRRSKGAKPSGWLDAEQVRRLDSYRPPAPGTDERLQQLMLEQPFAGDDRFGCYLISDNSRYSDIARAIECSVFQEFFGNGPSIMAREYGPYEAHSKFLLVVDRKTQQPAGALRIIQHSDNGLKTLNDIALEPLSIPTQTVIDYHGIEDLSQCWDVGSLAVLKPYRGEAAGHLVSTMLYGLFYSLVCKLGISHVVAILDGHAFAQLTEKFSVPFVPIAGSQPFPYLGSDNNRAAYARVSAVVPTMETKTEMLEETTRKILKPHLLRMMYGAGLPAIVEIA